MYNEISESDYDKIKPNKFGSNFINYIDSIEVKPSNHINIRDNKIVYIEKETEYRKHRFVIKVDDDEWYYVKYSIEKNLSYYGLNGILRSSETYIDSVKYYKLDQIDELKSFIKTYIIKNNDKGFINKMNKRKDKLYRLQKAYGNTSFVIRDDTD